MSCYVIVTWRSALWTLLGLAASLVTFYSLMSANWLVGFERRYSTRTDLNRSSAIVSYEDATSTEGASLYRPTIGLYNRCIRITERSKSVLSCSTFADNLGREDELFPIAWQASLVLSGMASILLVFTMCSSVISLCKQDICRKSIFTVSGLIQVLAGSLLGVALLTYPIGWTSPKVKYFCGPDADMYHPGECSIGWGYYTVIMSTVTLFVTGLLSISAEKATSHHKIDDEIRSGKRLICIS